MTDDIHFAPSLPAFIPGTQVLYTTRIMGDIYIERNVESSEVRAYTRIRLNRVTVGNRWLERTWSGFFGTTTSLLHKPGNSEWVVAQNPEFSLNIDGETIEPVALGEIEVSEECNEFGAVLRIRKARPGLDVTVTTTALHDVPALVRVVTVTNTAAEAVQLESMSSEMIEWEEKAGELVAHRFFKDATGPYQCGPEDPCIAMLHKNRGMLLGRLGDGELHLNTPNPYQCSVLWPCAYTLKPIEKWTAPPTYIIPCDADPLAAFLKHEPEVVEKLKLQERREEQIRESLNAEEAQ